MRRARQLSELQHRRLAGYCWTRYQRAKTYQHAQFWRGWLMLLQPVIYPPGAERAH